MIELSDIIQAKKSFKNYIPTTELQYSERLSNLYNANIYLKREDTQPIRSYKIRGSLNFMNNLTSQQKKNGVVCASAGNHAQGFALTCKNLNIKGNVYMPQTTPEQKVYKTKKFGGEYVNIVLTGDNFDEAFAEAKNFEKQKNATFVHPFDNEIIITGQATIGMEIMEQTDKDIDYIISPVGGGGIVGGLISSVTQISESTQIIGVEPEGAPSMKTSLKKGKNTSLEKIETFVDGASLKRVGNITFEICKNYGLEVHTVPENRICSTILEFLREDGIVVEPAGAMGLDVLKDIKEKIKGKNIVIIVSGSNFDFDRIQEIKERSLKYEGLKRYMLVSFPQRPGALKEFLNVLGENDDIVRFEYLKKNNKEKAPALIGIQTNNSENFKNIFKNMEEKNIYYEDITDNEFYFDLLI